MYSYNEIGPPECHEWPHAYAQRIGRILLTSNLYYTLCNDIFILSFLFKMVRHALYFRYNIFFVAVNDND